MKLSDARFVCFFFFFIFLLIIDDCIYINLTIFFFLFITDIVLLNHFTFTVKEASRFLTFISTLFFKLIISIFNCYSNRGCHDGSGRRRCRRDNNDNKIFPF